jgi:enoyl-CoA hydratase/carnithine racemase
MRLLVDQLGEATARAMLVGGRAITAVTAEHLGLVSEVVQPSRVDERARAVASEIAAWPAIATAGNRLGLDIVVGRAEGDVVALRLLSFVPEGPLAQTIGRFNAAKQSTAKSGDAAGAFRMLAGAIGATAAGRRIYERAAEARAGIHQSVGQAKKFTHEVRQAHNAPLLSPLAWVRLRQH